MTNHAKTLDTVLLLALPASGRKSEVRKYLAGLSESQCRDEFRIGPTVQLDDYPYVHLMRRVDDELAKTSGNRVFFEAPDRCFRDPREWGTLIELINEDHGDLLAHKTHDPKFAAQWLLERLDAAAAKAGIQPRLSALEAGARASLARALEKESRELLAEKNKVSATELAGKTIVIEFARGGAHGLSMPLPEPFGYGYSLGRLSKPILSKACILYVWVTPEESRRKNEERADPNDPGSILHHGVPLHVMMNDYGCDDMQWLETNSRKPGTVEISAHGKTFFPPIARFDNRVDKTSFVRADRAAWKPDQIRALHEGLKAAFRGLAQQD
ncbi:MAG: hypothetical protein HYW49_06530 [Deltaproteobacteria bacterium]|nr:hypothetical protein [Deltaproteobacteria bacterium]